MTAGEKGRSSSEDGDIPGGEAGPSGERASLVPATHRQEAHDAAGDVRPDPLEGEIEAYREPGVPGPVSAGRCGYCGCPLDPRLYFCAGCATPYKSVEDVIPHARPVRLTDGQLIAKKAPHAMPVFWTYFSVVVGCAILSLVLFGHRKFDWAVYFFLSELALLVTTCVVGALYWRSLVPQLRRAGRLLRWETLVGVAALVPLLAINYYYHNWAIDSLGLENTPPMNPLRDSGFSKPTLIVVACVFPAVLEEIALRGLVQHWMQVAVKPWKAIVFASALFAALHFNVVSAPYLFAVGVLLGWVKWRTGGLYGPMLVHFLHNLVVLELF